MIPKRLVPTRRTVCSLRKRRVVRRYSNSRRNSGCHDRAAEKKLAGAALTSFMKKCESDAATTCDTQAADKKLSGAAKTSFTKPGFC